MQLNIEVGCVFHPNKTINIELNPGDEGYNEAIKIIKSPDSIRLAQNLLVLRGERETYQIKYCPKSQKGYLIP
jgi:hypothetical protein